MFRTQIDDPVTMTVPLRSDLIVTESKSMDSRLIQYDFQLVLQMYLGLFTFKSMLFLLLDRILSIGFARHICATINPDT